MDIDMKQFHQAFFEESEEGLDHMESALLELNPGTVDLDTINSIFRAAHSIKGGSATFGFTAIGSFTHVMETLLDEMRDGKRGVTQHAVNLLLQSVDCLRDMLAAAKELKDLDEARVAEVQRQLESLLDHPHDDEDPITRGESSQPTPVASASGWRIEFRPYSGMLRSGNDVVRMFRALEELGDLEVSTDLSKLPSLNEIVPEDCYLVWELNLRGDVSREQVSEVFEWVEDECDLTINSLAPDNAESNQVPEAEAVAAQSNRKPTATSGDTASIRVGIDKVDAIINQVGELVITQSMLGQLGQDWDGVDNVDGTMLEKLRDGLDELERNTRELQESVMRIRMLPISFVFNRFPRLVHDISENLNKKVQLKLSGEQTELDKTVMEKIGDPMVHLVRNALDHGIEPAEERVAAGKPPTGTLQLNAFHRGGNIIIEISDDGRGLDRDKILNKARERGLIGPDEVPGDERIGDLIFHPGLSTAAEVSDLSGRGVGMDVVRRNINELGGSVTVQFESGKGSTFIVRLPLTLAILDGQLVRVGEMTFIVPLVSIIESLQIDKSLVNSIAGRADVYKFRDEYIPIIRVHDAFDIRPDTHELSGGLMVVVEGDGQKAGLVIDDLLAQQQVVIKSLETNFRRVESVAGATILGDGEVALILDVAGLLKFSRDNDPKKSAVSQLPPGTHDHQAA